MIHYVHTPISKQIPRPFVFDDGVCVVEVDNMAQLLDHVLENDVQDYSVFCTVEGYKTLKGDSSTRAHSRCFVDEVCSFNGFEISYPYDVNVFTDIIGDNLVNPEPKFMPLKDVGHLKVGDKGLAVRPVSGWKPFDGFVAKTDEDLFLDLETLTVTSRPSPYTMVAVSEAVNLEPVEFRFWVVDGEIVTGSRYSLKGEEKLQYENLLYTVAKTCAEDKAVGPLSSKGFLDCVVDVGILEDGKVPRIIEINSLSTSGWYKDMNVEKLLKSVESVMI